MAKKKRQERHKNHGICRQIAEKVKKSKARKEGRMEGRKLCVHCTVVTRYELWLFSNYIYLIAVQMSRWHGTTLRMIDLCALIMQRMRMDSQLATGN